MPNLTIAFCVLLFLPPPHPLFCTSVHHHLPFLLDFLLPSCFNSSHLFSHWLLLTHSIAYASLGPCDDFVLYQSVTCVLAQPPPLPCIHHVAPCAAAASTGRKAAWPRPCQPTARSSRLWWELLILQPLTQATQMISRRLNYSVYRSLCGHQSSSKVPDLCASYQLHLPRKAPLLDWNCRQMCSHLGAWQVFRI